MPTVRPDANSAPRDIARDLGWPMGRAKTAFSYADLADEAASRYWQNRPDGNVADLNRWRRQRLQDTTAPAVWLRRAAAM